MGRRHDGWPEKVPRPKAAKLSREDDEWGCYTIKPSASETIAMAETWLNKRDWEDWG